MQARNTLPALPLAQRYGRFRDSVFDSVADAALPGLELEWSELDLQSLWFSGAFGRRFASEDGREVEIADFGEWNAAAGPDFTNCAVRVDGVVLRGDVELDPDARDWERHRHGANPAYENVVLHVFAAAPETGRFYTRTAAHREVAQVRLHRGMLPEESRPPGREAAARLGRCAAPLGDMGEEQVESLLECAAQFRLRAKSERLHRLAAARGREQAVFESLARTMGYRGNELAFALVAQRLGLKRLLMADETTREALLFGAAGFLEDLPPDVLRPAARGYVANLWRAWWRERDSCQRWLQPGHRAKWRMSGIRPGNHPQRRLGALAAVLAGWKSLAAGLADAGKWSLAGWRGGMLELSHEFWSGHYTLTAPPVAKPVALIGGSRVNEVLANVAYPLLVPERSRLWAEYLEMPALLDNQKLRRAGARLFGRDEARLRRFSRRLFHQQGLLQIYQDFCLEDDSGCADCPFPERLKQWA
jgi:hypothetical protein